MGTWGEITHLKFNIAPEKLPSQKENNIATIHFQGIFSKVCFLFRLHVRCLGSTLQGTNP